MRRRWAWSWYITLHTFRIDWNTCALYVNGDTVFPAFVASTSIMYVVRRIWWLLKRNIADKTYTDLAVIRDRRYCPDRLNEAIINLSYCRITLDHILPILLKILPLYFRIHHKNHVFYDSYYSLLLLWQHRHRIENL